MKRIAVTVGLLAGLLLASVGHSGEVRVWTDNTGEFKTEAEFVSLVDGVVTLRKPGTQKTVKLPLERLSDQDQNYVDELVSKLEEEADQATPTASPPAATRPQPTTTAPPGGRRPPNNVINSVRGAVYRAETMNKMKQIALAIVQYEAARDRYPAAAIMTPDGKPGLSWRVAILPMLEENGLYRQFKLDEPWDSPHNKALVARMPSIYQSPGSELDSGYTNYLAVVSPDTIISTTPRGTRSRDVRDGTSRTVMIVEADDDYAAIWTKPDDYPWDATQPTYGVGHIWAGYFVAGFGDGAVGTLELSIGAEQINAYFSRAGGEVIQPNP
jgi:hypothetical protein